MAIIHLPSSLRKYTHQEREIHVEAQTLANAMKALCEKFSELKKHIVDDNFNPLLHVAIFIDGEQLDTTLQNSKLLKSDTQIALILALSGG